MLKKIMIAMIVVVMSTAAFAGSIAENKAAMIKAAKKNVTEIDPQTLKTWMDSSKKFLLLDVRTDPEFTAGTIEADNFAHVDRGKLEFSFTLKHSDAEEVIVVYCKAGSRGLLAAETLKELGYKNVYNLTGGIGGWIKAGLPVSNSLGLFKTAE